MAWRVRRMGGRAWERTRTTTTRRSPADRRSRGRTRGSRRERAGSNGPKRGGGPGHEGPPFLREAFRAPVSDRERPRGVSGGKRRGAAGARGRLRRVVAVRDVEGHRGAGAARGPLGRAQPRHGGPVRRGDRPRDAQDGAPLHRAIRQALVVVRPSNKACIHPTRKLLSRPVLRRGPKRAFLTP